jgi:hypothetical protein
MVMTTSGSGQASPNCMSLLLRKSQPSSISAEWRFVQWEVAIDTV